MGPFRSRLVVGLDASSVAAVQVSGGMGPPRVRAFARVPLPPGALVPGPVEANLARPDEVRDALAQLLREVAPGRTAATVIVPAGTARYALLDVPRGVAAREYARYRLLAGLPYPPEEGVADVLELGAGLAIGAVARRAVLEGYEVVVEEAGLVPERVDLAPLAALGARRDAGKGSTSAVDVILEDAAVSLAVFRDGTLRAFRSRIRDGGDDEASRLAAEAERTAVAGGLNGSPMRFRVAGRGAGALLRAWTEEGRAAEPSWVGESLPMDAAEVAWLGAALA